MKAKSKKKTRRTSPPMQVKSVRNVVTLPSSAQAEIENHDPGIAAFLDAWDACENHIFTMSLHKRQVMLSDIARVTRIRASQVEQYVSVLWRRIDVVDGRAAMVRYPMPRVPGRVLHDLYLGEVFAFANVLEGVDPLHFIRARLAIILQRSLESVDKMIAKNLWDGDLDREPMRLLAEIQGCEVTRHQHLMFTLLLEWGNGERTFSETILGLPPTRVMVCPAFIAAILGIDLDVAWAWWQQTTPTDKAQIDEMGWIPVGPPTTLRQV